MTGRFRCVRDELINEIIDLAERIVSSSDDIDLEILQQFWRAQDQKFIQARNHTRHCASGGYHDPRGAA